VLSEAKNGDGRNVQGSNETAAFLYLRTYVLERQYDFFPCKRAGNRLSRTGNQRRFSLSCSSTFSFSQLCLVSEKAVDGLGPLGCSAWNEMVSQGFSRHSSCL